MTKFNYEDESNKLAKAIDIAIESFSTYPPQNFDEHTLKQMISVYNKFKLRILSPNKNSKNKTTLKITTNDVLTYFQEASGVTIDFFWKEINRNNLGFKRENKLTKILKRNKIKNQIEYDFVIDTLVPYQQEGIISSDEVELLNKLISDYETKSAK